MFTRPDEVAPGIEGLFKIVPAARYVVAVTGDLLPTAPSYRLSAFPISTGLRACRDFL